MHTQNVCLLASLAVWVSFIRSFIISSVSFFFLLFYHVQSMCWYDSHSFTTKYERWMISMLIPCTQFFSSFHQFEWNASSMNERLKYNNYWNAYIYRVCSAFLLTICVEFQKNKSMAPFRKNSYDLKWMK